MLIYLEGVPPLRVSVQTTSLHVCRFWNYKLTKPELPAPPSSLSTTSPSSAVTLPSNSPKKNWSFTALSVRQITFNGHLISRKGKYKRGAELLRKFADRCSNLIHVQLREILMEKGNQWNRLFKSATFTIAITALKGRLPLFGPSKEFVGYSHAYPIEGREAASGECLEAVLSAPSPRSQGLADSIED
ncbi:hypothetical protein BV898_03151 [Hypsibius exemplaris]|uniref:Uncharacterized protein n=1 Tax=Hypsibius exemplaris TaxID=2072580 RepID=A0A1W0X6B3_HYPEX|nr:hypothetical protein BV898_03151 [Hypsibius exemplaris]